MARRAKLSLSPEADSAAKRDPRLDAADADADADADAPSREDAPSRPARGRNRATGLDARRIAQLALVAAVGVVSVYLIARRLSRKP